MKQKDIVIIIATVFVSGIFSYVICNNFLFNTQSQKQTAEKVNPITSIFTLPDNTIFNPEATNPTKVIEIGPNSNSQPFTDVK